ncbi:MAG: beta strand repeat-containing protein, partial [Gemmobacter sp.]
GAITAGAGTTSVTGTITNAASLTVAGGTVNLTGAGSVDTSGNTIAISAGALTTDGDGIADNEAVTVSATGTLTTTGADTIASLTQTGGTVDGSSTLTVTGAYAQSGGTTGGTVTVASGTFAQSGGAIVAAGTTVTSAGAQTLSGGTIAGALNGAGAITAGAGTTSVTGTITNAASLTVAGGTVNLTGAGSVDTSGNTIEVIAGMLTNDGDGIANTEAVLISGGTLTTTGADTIASLTQTGGLVNGGAVLTAGTFSQSGGTMAGNVNTITSATLNGASITGTLSGGDVTVTTNETSVTGGGQITAANLGITSGTLRTDGGALSAGVSVSNAGTFVFTGTETVGGLNGGGTTNLGGTDGVDNILRLGGGANSVTDQTFILGYDELGSGDRLVSVAGDAFGAGARVYDIILTGNFTDLTTRAVVVDNQQSVSGTLSVRDTMGNNLNTGGALLYSLTNQGGNTVLAAEANPAAGGIASGVSLTQSIVANVVNRPSSPFASGLASERGCSQGGYGRAVGGRTKAKGSSFAGVVSRENELTANYFGVQAGYDFICNDGRFFDGWNGGAGAILGYNSGKTNQPVNLDLGGGAVTTTSITKSDFKQTYGGFYVVGNRDALTIDAQVRFEDNSYTMREQVIAAGAGLGLENDKFTTKGVNFTGRVSYNVPINNEGLNFVPTAGFSVTRTGSSTLKFTRPDVLGNNLVLDAYTSKVGFIGGTLAKTTINEEAASGSTLFISGNYYHEFGGQRTSTFTAAGTSTTITSENLGGFGELSLGLNYIKVLENGPAGARQLNTNLRLDTRFGKNISDSYSLTAQVRLSF